MTRLSIGAGPPTALPLAFLFAAPAWGCIAGLLLAVDGAPVLLDRWAPPTLACVHAITLGLLGNAMAGALLQFLPAAAGVRVRGGPRVGAALFALLNAGALALVCGFHSMASAWLATGAALSAAAFALLAACVLPGLAARLRDALHRGIAVAVVALLCTAALGVAMVSALIGITPAPAPLRWTDVHAGWGLLGGVLVLLASVGQVVLPMFQAVPAQPERRQAMWTAATYLSLSALALLVAVDKSAFATPLLAACAAAWALSMLVRQARTPLRRAGPLRLAWIGGAVAMLAAALASVLGAQATLVGALVLALALPLPVMAMLLEIVAFLGWIELQRRAPRGRRVPAVHVLVPTRDRAAALGALAASGVAVVAAVHWPALARAAGLGLAGAFVLLLVAALGMRRRSSRFLAQAAST